MAKFLTICTKALRTETFPKLAKNYLKPLMKREGSEVTKLRNKNRQINVLKINLQKFSKFEAAIDIRH